MTFELVERLRVSCLQPSTCAGLESFPTSGTDPPQARFTSPVSTSFARALHASRRPDPRFMGFGEGIEHFLRIKRPYACIRPSRHYVLFRERLLERRPEERKEVSFADACVPFRLPNKVVERLAVVISQWGKDAHI